MDKSRASPAQALGRARIQIASMLGGIQTGSLPIVSPYGTRRNRIYATADKPMDTQGAVVAHPNTTPFAAQVARAFLDSNQLSAFFTTVSYDPDAWWQRILFAASRFVGISLESRFQRRILDGIPPSFIRSYPWRELVRMLSTKLDRSGCITDSIWEWAEVSFDRWVADQLDSNVKLAYSYEHAALATLTRARELGILAVYDVPAPEHTWVANLLAQERSTFPELESRYAKKTERRKEARTARRHAEWKAADLIVANSEFCKNTYRAAGLDVSKVVVIPYGSPPPHPAALQRADAQGPLRFLWAGTFSVRKGAHYLLEAWKQVQPQKATLQVLGANELPARCVADLPASITIEPTVSRAALSNYYVNADLLIFPTLCDGFGMVVTEALAHGLPVLTTPYAGAASFITDKQNGYLLTEVNTTSIAHALEWCCENIEAIRKMRPAAMRAAAQWQWSDYRDRIAHCVIQGHAEKAVAGETRS